MNQYARFRADPTKVRVSIRRHLGAWYATVAERKGQERSVVRYDELADRAIDSALIVAADREFDGIDQWKPSTGGLHEP